MFSYAVRSLHLAQSCLITEQSRIMESSGYDPQKPETMTEEIEAALNLVDERIAEVRLAARQLDAIGKIQEKVDLEA